MPLVPCGCAVEHPVCELGQSLLSLVALWYDLVDAPDFLSRSLEERDATLTCFRNILQVYLSHCGYPVQKGSCL